ncbi:DUF3987 domain-containing protein [Falsiroseomonas oryziterrae]|uniref:DUF3987 domain-containing protein n=1 Tax=Falsiroseomonas oryziterrae TaxID=2911368 RepID=UPI001F391316|nr:DUF3987 domain-containing protein [Roseomonas sp. NPKOSM-4]
MSGGQLHADADAIGSFVGALFRYADPDTFASLRAFHDRGNAVFRIAPHRIGDSLDGLTAVAIGLATEAANAAHPVVFCPPVATFATDASAKEADLANGLALSVECDAAPRAARARLETLLGPATVVVASGGECVNGETGEAEPKLHLHWRLTEPTRDPGAHAALKRARILATRLVGADATNTPMVHPIRWPGSWHRKQVPRLARIVALAEPREIDLTEALGTLQDAAEAVGLGDTRQSAGAGSTAPGEARETCELIRAILAAEDYHAPLAALAMRLLKGGTPDAQAVELLRGLMLAVPERERDVKDGAPSPGRWQARFDGIPRAVSSARAKLGERQPDGGADWPDPLDFLGDAELTGAPELRRDHLPDALAGFVFDTAERMGVDPAAVALCAVVTCASVASDAWAIQPKVHDDAWTESPRLWGAVVGDPSIRKTPILKACTRPVDDLEEAARKRHAEAMATHRAAVGKLKKDKVPPEEYPPAPRLDRFLVEGTTIEALSEALRDDEEAKQRAPAGKVLVRQDELSEWTASFDAYKGGGRGSADRGAYLRLFNGGRFTVDRVGRGTFAIPNWSGCVLGGIQPEPIQRIARDATDDGLLQRFLYVVPAGETEGQDRRPDDAALARYRALFPVLAGMKPPGAFGARFVVKLDAEAQRQRQAIEALAKAHAAMPDTSTRLKASLGKWSGIFPRLALTFHLAAIADAKARGETPPFEGTLSGDTARRAASFMRDVLFPHLLRAEGLLFLTKQSGHARWVAGFILSNDECRTKLRLALRDVQRAYGALRAPEHRAELVAVLQSLEVVGWLRAEPPDNPARQVSTWHVNPKLHATFAERAAAERERRRRSRDAILSALAERAA